MARVDDLVFAKGCAKLAPVVVLEGRASSSRLVGSRIALLPAEIRWIPMRIAQLLALNERRI